MAKPARPHSARAVAAQILTDVIKQQHSLNTSLANLLPTVKETDRALCQQLCYGVLRWYPLLNGLGAQLLSKALKAKDNDIHMLLLMGLYQLREMRTPPHAALSETVNAAAELRKTWAKGLLNACLRNYQRQRTEVDAQLQPELAFAHPPWMLTLLRQDWPQHWQQIAEANNCQPPMMLRVNRQQTDRDNYLKLLEQVDIHATPLPMCSDGLLLSHPCDINLLPSFEQGWVSVQDGAAQCVVEIMDLQQGLNVLDACSAPGGKTCHMLEHIPSLNMTALDIDGKRLQQVQANLDRLSLTARLITADAAETDQWWDGILFDRILIDAPCSGSGVIRRHPDIKVLRRPDDVASLAARQQQLLDKLWPLLKPGGLMVYTTCSAFKQENELQVDAFLQRHPDAAEVEPAIVPARAVTHGYQRLPGDDVLDGFYYACLRRN